jgi:putative membrane protein
MTWKEAFLKSPGPDSLRAAGILSLKGVCMGTADIIPGVSGGTIALITGIYQELLMAIKSADMAVLRLLLAGNVKGAVAKLHLRFLLPLFLGIGVAVVSLARVMNYLLHHQPVFVWSLFLGLVMSSIFLVGSKVDRWRGTTVGMLSAGTAAAWFIVSRVPVSTPETWGFIFFSGMVAICAMILPGISGAFILLILGKYAFITGTLKNPFIPYNLAVIAVFGTGCLIGIMGFSRFLNHLLSTRYQATMAFLTGLLAGSLPRLWPWQVAVESQMIRGEMHVITTRNVFPQALDSEVAVAVFLFCLGAAAVLFLERISRSKSPQSGASA